MLGIGKIQLVIAVVAMTAIAGLSLWNKSLRSELRAAEKREAGLEVALAEQKSAARAAVANAQEWRVALEELQRTHEELRLVAEKSSTEARRLQAIFARHDLTALALAKPGLIENRINRGSADALSVLTRLTRVRHEAAGSGETAGSPGAARPSPARTGAN